MVVCVCVHMQMYIGFVCVWVWLGHRHRGKEMGHVPSRPVNVKILHRFPSFQNGPKSGFEVCFGRPSTLGAGAETRLHTPKAVTYHKQPHYCRFMIGHSLERMESRIKKFKLHCICRPDTTGSSPE